MRAVIQRVEKADVKIDGEVFSEIGKGLVILLGVEKGDTLEDVEFISRKVVELRCFENGKNKMNIALKDAGGEVLVVSEVTLCTDLAGGRRPDFEMAAPPAVAERLYQDLVNLLKSQGAIVKQGKFKIHMRVNIVNDGPVTFFLKSR